MKITEINHFARLKPAKVCRFMGKKKTAGSMAYEGDIGYWTGSGKLMAVDAI